MARDLEDIFFIHDNVLNVYVGVGVLEILSLLERPRLLT